MTQSRYEPDAAEARQAPKALEATSTAIGGPVSLQAEQLDVLDSAQLLADLEPCRCELGRCTSCENLPWVIRQRQLAQTVTTLNSSPSSWDTDTPLADAVLAELGRDHTAPGV